MQCCEEGCDDVMKCIRKVNGAACEGEQTKALQFCEQGSDGVSGWSRGSPGKGACWLWEQRRVS